MKSYEFYIAGVQFHEAKKVISQLSVGDTLELVPEPSNKFDPNAIAIKASFMSIRPDGSDTREEIMLGYVPKKFSAEVTAFLEVYGTDKVFCDLIEVNPKNKPWEQLKVHIYNIDNEEETDEVA